MSALLMVLGTAAVVRAALPGDPFEPRIGYVVGALLVLAGALRVYVLRR